MNNLSIIIPTYNEAENIVPLIKEIEIYIAEVENFEIIVVDDNSPDNTYKKIQTFIHEKNRANIHVIKRTWNKGLSSAIIEGSALAKFNYIAVMDGDGQHDPQDLNTMFKTLIASKKDLIIGSRFYSIKMVSSLSSKRNLLSRIGNFFIRLVIKKELSDPLSGFFVAKASVLKANPKELYKEGFKILFDVLMINKNLQIKEMQINFRKRNTGLSKLNLAMGLSLIGQVLENYTYRIFPSSFFVFSFIGTFGVLIHLCILYLILAMEVNYIQANFLGTIGALASNYFLNNLLTFNNFHKTWPERFNGLLRYAVANSLSIFANIGIAAQLYSENFSILFSTFTGIFAGLILNYLLSKNLVFKN